MAPHVGRRGGNGGGPLPRAGLLTGFQATRRLCTSRMGRTVISLTAKHKRRLSGNCRGAALTRSHPNTTWQRASRPRVMGRARDRRGLHQLHVELCRRGRGWCSGSRGGQSARRTVPSRDLAPTSRHRLGVLRARRPGFGRRGDSTRLASRMRDHPRPDTRSR